jgi:hypothetical protein
LLYTILPRPQFTTLSISRAKKGISSGKKGSSESFFKVGYFQPNLYSDKSSFKPLGNG